MEAQAMTKYITRALVFIAATVAAGCTMSDNNPPPLAGPSEMSLSLTITASPDVLSLDGASQTLVTIEARDSNGQPAANVPLRVEIIADGQFIDFGSISARTLVTNSNGRATFVYTAPSFVNGTIPDLQLSVTPTGSDASGHVRRLVAVRLVPPGVIAGAPNAVFTFAQQSSAAFTDVRFDGSQSTPGLGAVITSYAWDFGDGTSGTGMTATHRYTNAGVYAARLTVTDSNGISSQSVVQAVTVTDGSAPTATFVFSPTAPAPGSTVFFNASQSTPGPGHRIVSYRWNWGDGRPSGSGSSASHVFPLPPATWVVVLTVTDEVGQVGRFSLAVPVGVEPPEEEEE
jgi:PKD repeat protein